MLSPRGPQTGTRPSPVTALNKPGLANPENWASGPCSSPGVVRGSRGSPRRQDPHLCTLSPPQGTPGPIGVPGPAGPKGERVSAQRAGSLDHQDRGPAAPLSLGSSAPAPAAHRATTSASHLGPHPFLLDPASTSSMSSLDDPPSPWGGRQA